MEIIALVIALSFVVIYIVSGILITIYLRNKGEKINYLFLSLFVISYANKYKNVSLEENGKVGILFYLWIFSINCALLVLLLFLLLSFNNIL